jgi:hypothetical protein
MMMIRPAVATVMLTALLGSLLVAQSARPSGAPRPTWGGPEL